MHQRAGGLTPEQFVEKWSKAQLSERAASQEHFTDLCRLLGQPTPAEADPTGNWQEDWADVWHDTGAGRALPADHPLAAKRAEIDQKVLANLLRLNHARAVTG